MAVQLDVFVGIQIGTHYNSLVCFFPYDETRYPSPTWDDPSTGKVQSKQRTIAVYSPNKVFQAFGHEAVKQIQGQNNTNLLVLSNFVNDIFCSGIQVRHMAHWIWCDNIWRYSISFDNDTIPTFDNQIWKWLIDLSFCNSNRHIFNLFTLWKEQAYIPSSYFRYFIFRFRYFKQSGTHMTLNDNGEINLNI